MKFIALIGLLLFSVMHANAHFETSTTIYGVRKEYDDMILVKVDKATLKETTRKLPLKKHAEHGTYLFSDDDQTMYLTSECEKDLVVFNHRNGRLIKRVKLDNPIQSFAIHGNYGYALIGKPTYGIPSKLQIINLTTYVITSAVLPNPEENMGQSYTQDGEFFIHNGKGYHLLTGHTKLYTLNLATNTYEPNPLKLTQDQSYLGRFGKYVYTYEFALGGNSKYYLWDIETKTLVHSLKDMSNHLKLLGVYKNKLYYTYEEQDDILIYDFETKQTTRMTLRKANCSNPEAYIRNQYLYLWFFDLSTRKFPFCFINMDEETVDPSFIELFTESRFETEHFNRHLYQGFTKVLPLLPSKEELMGPHLAVFLADFKAYNPAAFQLGRVKKHHASLTANGFDTLAVYTLFDDVFSKLTALDCLNIFLILQNPKNRLQSVPGQKLLKEVVYKELFLSLFKKDNATAAAMIKCLVQLEDPLVTPLATFETYQAPADIQSSDPDRRVRRKVNS